jgi:hypothetical protein
MLGKALLSASVSAAPGAYVEDVFSTYLYTGNDSPQTITNGIDLAGEGGMVWQKRRSSAGDHFVMDTERDPNYFIYTNFTNEEGVGTSGSSFNSDGFTIGAENNLHNTNDDVVSWTFRKAEKFFDVVTYTGNGTAGRTVSHNLGSVPGFIIVKSTSDSADWVCYHRSLGNGYAIYLNKTEAQDGPSKPSWNQTSPTSTEFTVGVDGYNTNNTGVTYVAYLFAHNAGGFGDAGTDNVISCGSFTDTLTGGVVNLGYEPQFVLVKSVDDAGSWFMLDTMRGWINDAGAGASGQDKYLLPNSSGAEGNYQMGEPTATGFRFTDNGSGTYIYIAIRRGPMRAPTDGTEVFAPAVQGQTPTDPTWVSSFVSDWVFTRQLSVSDTKTSSRLQGFNYMETNNTGSESSDTNHRWDFMNGFGIENSQTDKYAWMYRRAPGFFDVVCYTGTGSARTVTHNLGAVPELMIVKCRSSASTDWRVYSSSLGNNKQVYLNYDYAVDTPTNTWNNTTPTSSVFSVGGSGLDVNNSGQTYVAYLFVTCAGVSKVGSYTGTGTTLSIDCGFTAGARFILIKRTDSTGDWYVWDTARGIIAGNDPYLLLNSSAAEVTNTDYIDPLSSGFQISSTAPAAINASGGTYIFLAIA